MIRSTLSILAGYVVMAALIMVATIVSARLMLHVSGVEGLKTMKPTPAFIVVNLVYSGVFAVLGGFLTAVIAKRAPMTHALVLAGIMIAMGSVSMFLSPGNEEPGWYNVALLILGPACVSLGGYLQRLRQTGSTLLPPTTPTQSHP